MADEASHDAAPPRRGGLHDRLRPGRLERALFDDAGRHVDRFGVLLMATVAAVVILSLVDVDASEGGVGAAIGIVAVSGLVGAMLVLSLRAAGLARRWRRPVEVLVTVGVVAIIFVALADLALGRDIAGVARPSLLWLALALLAPIAVVRRILRHRRVTLSTLLGAVAAYLLIAVSFDFVYLTVEGYESEPFFGRPESTTRFMNFSLTTITTIGTDITPGGDLGRLLAAAEVVIGQLFLVTLVAALVGMFAEAARGKGAATGR